MKKISFIVACLFLLTLSISAQDTTVQPNPAAPGPREAIITYDKVQVPGHVIDIPVGEDVAKEAIKKRFKQMGADIKERKGFMEFKNVSIAEINNGKLVDAYVNVEKKSKKDKDNSIVSLIVTEPGVAPGASTERTSSGIATGTGVDATGAFGLLSTLHENSADYGVELEIKKQEEAVKKAEKEYKNLVEDGEDLQNKLKKTQNEIEANKNKQQKQSEEVSKQKEMLLQVQSKRRMAAGQIKN
jgi:peptidoglycan hydrolase CwlO-like protein